MIQPAVPPTLEYQSRRSVEKDQSFKWGSYLFWEARLTASNDDIDLVDIVCELIIDAHGKGFSRGKGSYGIVDEQESVDKVTGARAGRFLKYFFSPPATRSKYRRR